MKVANIVKIGLGNFELHTATYVRCSGDEDLKDGEFIGYFSTKDAARNRAIELEAELIGFKDKSPIVENKFWAVSRDTGYSSPVFLFGTRDDVRRESTFRNWSYFCEVIVRPNGDFEYLTD